MPSSQQEESTPLSVTTATDQSDLTKQLEPINRRDTPLDVTGGGTEQHEPPPQQPPTTANKNSHQTNMAAAEEHKPSSSTTPVICVTDDETDTSSSKSGNGGMIAMQSLLRKRSLLLPTTNNNNPNQPANHKSSVSGTQYNDSSASTTTATKRSPSFRNSFTSSSTLAALTSLRKLSSNSQIARRNSDSSCFRLDGDSSSRMMIPNPTTTNDTLAVTGDPIHHPPRRRTSSSNNSSLHADDSHPRSSARALLVAISSSVSASSNTSVGSLSPHGTTNVAAVTVAATGTPLLASPPPPLYHSSSSTNQEPPEPTYTVSLVQEEHSNDLYYEMSSSEFRSNASSLSAHLLPRSEQETLSNTAAPTTTRMKQQPSPRTTIGGLGNTPPPPTSSVTTSPCRGPPLRGSGSMELVRPSVEIQKEQKLSSALSTMNQLRFDKLQRLMIGREWEVERLQTCLNQILSWPGGGPSVGLASPLQQQQQEVSVPSSPRPENVEQLEPTALPSTPVSTGIREQQEQEEHGQDPPASPPPPVVAIAVPIRVDPPHHQGTIPQDSTTTTSTSHGKLPERQGQFVAAAAAGAATAPREVVFLSGPPGTGKTTLACTLREPIERAGGLFVLGKHDIKLQEQPLSGIGLACNELCREILYHHHKQRRRPNRPRTTTTTSQDATNTHRPGWRRKRNAPDQQHQKEDEDGDPSAHDDKDQEDHQEMIEASEKMASMIRQDLLASIDRPLLHLLESIIPLLYVILTDPDPKEPTTIKNTTQGVMSYQQVANSGSGNNNNLARATRDVASSSFSSHNSSTGFHPIRSSVRKSHVVGRKGPQHSGPAQFPLSHNKQETESSDSTKEQVTADRSTSSARDEDGDAVHSMQFSKRQTPVGGRPDEMNVKLSDWTPTSIVPSYKKHGGRKSRAYSRSTTAVRTTAIKNYADDSSCSSLSFARPSLISRRRLDIDPSQSKQLVQFAIRTFFKIFATRLGPLVIVLDDLQWADPSSLDILAAVAGDVNIPNLMVIGCYRSDAVDTTHYLSKTIQVLRAGAMPPPPSSCSSVVDHDDNGYCQKEYNFTEIRVGNLSLLAVTDLIVELLSISPEKAKSLATVCFKRTMGNVFFVKEFLMLLQQMEILQFNIGSFLWTWDEERLEKETAATFNVVSMIKMKIDKYTDGMVLFLSVAACLGNTFDITTIELLWGQLEQKYEGTAENVDDLLNVALHDMLIESVDDSSYRFIHDKVQETAMLLMPQEEFSEFRSDIGKCLYENLTDEDLENMLFVVADLLNDGLYEGMEMGELNASAAEKARELSAFNSAVHYVEKGIMSLNCTDMWKDHPTLTLLLYSIGAEAEECACNHEKSEWYCKEVRKQEGLPVLGKMRITNIVVERLYADGMYDELWPVCLDTLDQLGCILPRRLRCQKFSAAISMYETKRYYLPVADEVESMGMIEDDGKREAIAFMLKAASFCLGSKNKPLYVLLCCRCLQWTKLFGLTSHTASGFASFANVLMHEYGDWKTAIKIAEISLSIENRLGSNYTKTSTLHKINSFVLGWVKPLRTCRANYLEAYREGMLSGNIGGVGMSILFFLMCEFYSGSHKLESLEQDLRNFIPQMGKLKLHTFVLGLRLLWQKVLNLIGAAYNPQSTALTGTAMHGIDIERHPFIYNTVGRHHICNLCAYFSEYEKGAEIALAMGDEFYKTWSGASYFGFEPFSRALCLYARAIETGQSKYLKAARKARKTLARWVKLGAMNLVHELFLLDAEEAVVRGQKKAAHKAYKLAISASVRGGFLQDAGIANERYALYLIRLDMLTFAAFHVKDAIQNFSEWGALRKVEQLHQTHDRLLSIALE